jgi:hypothetical protein
MISLFVAGQLAWHFRAHDYGVRPLTVWALLVALGLVVAAYWPRNAPSEAVVEA